MYIHSGEATLPFLVLPPFTRGHYYKTAEKLRLICPYRKVPFQSVKALIISNVLGIRLVFALYKTVFQQSV